MDILYRGLCVLLLVCITGVVHASDDDSQCHRNTTFDITVTGRAIGTADQMRVTLFATKDGESATMVRDQLNNVTSKTLNALSSYKKKEKLSVATSSFSIYPHYKRQKISGWTGTSEIILTSNDIVLMSRVITAADSMQIGNTQFQLSQKIRDQLRVQAQRDALVRFQNRAQDLAEQLGGSDFRIISLKVDYEGPHTMRTYAQHKSLIVSEMSERTAEPLAVSPGKEEVIVKLFGIAELKK